MSPKEHIEQHKAGSQKQSPQPSPQIDDLQAQSVFPSSLFLKGKLNPSLLTPDRVLQLERTIGNQVVQRLMSNVIQRYEDDSLDAIQHLSLQDVFRVFCIDQDEMEFTTTDGQTVCFTIAWVASQRGIAILRGEIRHNIQTMIHASRESAGQIQAWIDGLTGASDRIDELNQTLARAEEREGEIANAPETSSSLVEQGRQGRNMEVRGRLRGPLTPRPGETPEQLAERTRRKEQEVHSAMDVPGRPGTAVYVPIAGRVIWAGPGDPGSSGMGTYVRILHPSPPRTRIAGDRPLVTHYCHLQEILVTTGTQVHANQAIGLIGFTTANASGSSGNVTPLSEGGAHLHFGVLIAPTNAAGEPNPEVGASTTEEVSRGINPATWLSELGVRLDEVGYQRPRPTGTRGRLANPPARAGAEGEAPAPAPTSEETTRVEEGPVQEMRDTTTVVQAVRPGYIVGSNFLGIHIPVSEGVHPDMVPRLNDVETHLQTQYSALPAAERARYPSLRDYAGVQTVRGWRETTSQHGTGRAIDVNAAEQPYIATRTSVGGSPVYGGEEGRATEATRALRQPAVEVYDRAVEFTRMDPEESTSAEVGNRRVGETATEVYRRFRRTSDALQNYLSLAFRTNYTAVSRQPIPNPETASEDDLINGIPTSERYDEATAIENIEQVMMNAAWIDVHPEYYITAREQFIQILRDYEIVRRPMQMGDPSVSPARTRNPARGFLHMPEHFVVAMMDVGHLRWGACEFSAASNGDVHHFDLATPRHEP